jgi:uncharacterized protein YndB with AHSA1/START domain
MTPPIIKALIIDANPSSVWNALTDHELMKQWMGEPAMELEIITDWKETSTITIKGFHHVKFENTGVVVQYEPERVLQYTHLSSLSKLPDEPENYSIIEFRLNQVDEQTKLTLTLSNFPTESIRKHLDFYWTTTLEILRAKVEGTN